MLAASVKKFQAGSAIVTRGRGTTWRCTDPVPGADREPALHAAPWAPRPALR